MADTNERIDDKLIMSMAIISKAMEQIDSVLKDDNSQRIVHWKNNLYTINEDIQDFLTEKNNLE